jgi:hypothetical protein
MDTTIIIMLSHMSAHLKASNINGILFMKQKIVGIM